MVKDIEKLKALGFDLHVMYPFGQLVEKEWFGISNFDLKICAAEVGHEIAPHLLNKGQPSNAISCISDNWTDVPRKRNDKEEQSVNDW